MAITFFETRTLARNAAKELNNGKVKDMGKDAGDKRWAVEYTSKTDVINAIAEQMSEQIEVIALAEDAPHDLSGLPMVEHKRVVLKAPHATSEPAAREFVLKDRKNNPVLVNVRRSKTAAKLAAHMARHA